MTNKHYLEMTSGGFTIVTHKKRCKKRPLYDVLPNKHGSFSYTVQNKHSIKCYTSKQSLFERIEKIKFVLNFLIRN